MKPTSARLAVLGLSAGFPGRPVLKDLDLSAKGGEIITINGENGCGKTTLARAIAGLLPVRTGNIVLDDRNITHLSPWRRRDLGLRIVPQSDRIFRDLTVAQNVSVLGARPRGNDIRPLPASIANASWLRESWHGPAGNLSGGRQALLALAAAAQEHTGLLLLDEPAAELDDEMVELAAEIVRGARGQGAAVIIFEHRSRFSRQVANRELSLADGTLH